MAGSHRHPGSAPDDTKISGTGDYRYCFQPYSKRDRETADYIGIIAGGTLGYQGGMPKKNHLEELFMKIAMEQAGRERDA